MSVLTFEDLDTGATFRAGPIAVTREAIIAFARTYDPQPFHLDEAAGAASLLDGLAASGWQTNAFGMRLLIECFPEGIASMGGPGIDEVRWLRPVRPGDALSLVTTIAGKRESASRPELGFVTLVLDLRNGANEKVMTQRSPIMVQRRGTTSVPRRGTLAPPPPAPAFAAPPPADPMLTAFYDELVMGHATTLGTQHFTAELILDFARLYDPQDFHLDLDKAAASQFGGLIASGWQTAAFWMRHYVDARTRSGETRKAAGSAAAVGGPSPGFTNMKWIRPVYAGEAITYGCEITAKRRAGLTGWGLVMTRNTGHSADGTLVFSFDGRLLWPLTPP